MTPAKLERLAACALLAAGAALGCGGGSTPGGAASCAAESGNICTLAGTGVAGDGADMQSALKTNIYLPQDVTIAPDGRPYIADWNNHRIRRIETDGTMTIVAGIGELGLSADDPTTNRLNHPTNVTFDVLGNLVIAAWHNSRIKTVDLATLAISDMCGNGMRAFAGDGGPASAAALNLPVAVVYDANWNLIIADQANDRLRKVDAATGVISTIAGQAPCVGTVADCPLGDGGAATSANLSFPAGQAAQPGGRIDIDPDGNFYIADTTHARVRKVDAATNVITTIAGNGTPGYSGDGGPATDASISNVSDVAFGPDGAVYIADTGNSCVRAVSAAGVITTIVGACGQSGFGGDGGPAASARLDRPTGIAFDPQGNLYVADTHNQRVRIVYK